VHRPLQLGGKLTDRGGMLSVVRPGTLFYVTDSGTNKRFLVDSGSTFSILPFSSPLPQSGP
jgi:hypothetical protein